MNHIDISQLLSSGWTLRQIEDELDRCENACRSGELPAVVFVVVFAVILVVGAWVAR